MGGEAAEVLYEFTLGSRGKRAELGWEPRACHRGQGVGGAQMVMRSGIGGMAQAGAISPRRANPALGRGQVAGGDEFSNWVRVGMVQQILRNGEGSNPPPSPHAPCGRSPCRKLRRGRPSRGSAYQGGSHGACELGGWRAGSQHLFGPIGGDVCAGKTLHKLGGNLRAEGRGYALHVLTQIGQRVVVLDLNVDLAKAGRGQQVLVLIDR